MALTLQALKSVSTSIATAVFVPVNLETLASSAPNPFDLEDLATGIGVSPDLLRRVSSRRQALPRQLVLPIAQRLGVQEGEVEAAAGTVLAMTALGSRALTAYPADRIRGEPLYFRPLSETTLPTFG